MPRKRRPDIGLKTKHARKLQLARKAEATEKRLERLRANRERVSRLRATETPSQREMRRQENRLRNATVRRCKKLRKKRLQVDKLSNVDKLQKPLSIMVTAEDLDNEKQEVGTTNPFAECKERTLSPERTLAPIFEVLVKEENYVLTDFEDEDLVTDDFQQLYAS